MQDWAGCLTGIFAKKGADELIASKAVKKAVKLAAARHSDQPPDVLRASLQAFLRGGDGGFRLEGGKVIKVVRKKKKKAKRDKAAASAAAAAAATAVAAAAAPEEAAGSGPPARKKQKKAGTEGRSSSQQQQEEEQQDDEQAAATAAATKDGRKQSKKRKASRAEQQEQEQRNGEAPPAGKRRKKAAGAGGTGGRSSNPPAAAGAAATGADSGDGAAAGGSGGIYIDGQDVAGVEMRWRDNNKRTQVKSGAFSKAEKETLRQAVDEYAAANNMSTDDLSWLYASSKSSATKGAWAKIASSLPHRLVKSVWAAGTRMLHEGNYQGKWSPEEDAQLLQLVSERGRKWKEIGGSLGRMPDACRDRYLMIRLGDSRKSGKWQADEVERLRQAVEEYLAARTAAEQQRGAGEDEATLTLGDIEDAAQEPLIDEDGAATVTVSRRIVLDDIDWNVVSQAVGTRSNVQCLEKWYSQLSPSMVARGDWGSGDDRRLLRALYISGACYDYDLDWAQLVRGRTAAQARRRWRLMLKVIPDSRDQEFSDLVDQLVEKYLPALRHQRQEQQQEEQQQEEEQEEEAG